MTGCKRCREKHAKAATEEVLPTEQEAILRTRLRGNLVAALEETEDAQCEKITTTLVETAIALNKEDMAAAAFAATPPGEAAHPSLAHAAPDRFRGLKIEIAEFFKNHGAAAVLSTLRATQEERLGRKLNCCEVRDRKFPRVILSAVLAALRHDPVPLSSVAIQDVAAATDLYVAMELTLLKPHSCVSRADLQAAAGVCTGKCARARSRQTQPKIERVRVLACPPEKEGVCTSVFAGVLLVYPCVLTYVIFCSSLPPSLSFPLARTALSLDTGYQRYG